MTVQNEISVENVKKILKFIAKDIQKKRSSKDIAPEIVEHQRWKITDFKYTSEGASYSSAELEPFKKQFWSNTIPKLRNQYNELDSTKKLIKTITKKIPDVYEFQIHMFLDRFISDCLDKKHSNVTIDTISKDFIQSLNDESVTAKTNVYLTGLTLENKQFNLDHDIKLRQISKEDIQIETPSYELSGKNFYQYPIPSSVLELSIMIKNPSELQRKIHNTITSLQLFKIGNIRYKEYRLSANSVKTMIGGTFFSHQTSNSNIICYIEKNDEKNLKRFVSNIEPYVIKFLDFSGNHGNFQDIAFRRYNDSLNSNNFEKQISDAIMGLESIFLGDNNQELKFRLSNRASILLGILGLESIKIRDELGDAYDIRSKFVHGGMLDYKKTKKLETKYGKPKNLLLSILDYLRLSIVTMITINMGKEELLDLMDNSLLDDNDYKKLEGVLSNTQGILNLK